MIGLGFNLTLSGGGGNPLARYVSGGAVPGFVTDFPRGVYYDGSFGASFTDVGTFSRASTATYVDGDGDLQTVGVNVPRVGHHVWNGSAWVNEGLLHESEARTNLVPHSEDRTNAGWTNTNVTVTDDGTSIIGLSASKMTFGAGSNLFSENVGAVVGDYVTLSAFVARGDADDHGAGHRFGFYDNTAVADVGYINFNYGTGVTSVQSGSVFAHDAEEVDGGWRIYMTIAHTTGNTLTAYFGAVGADAGTGYFYLAGPQVEAGPTPSSYIPTSGSTATRAAETLTIPAVNLPWPAPEYIGPELGDAANLDKRAATSGTVTRTDGVINFVNAAAGLSTAISEEITGLTIGNVYRFVANVRYVSGGPVALDIRSASGGGGSAIASSAPTTSATFTQLEILWVASATSAFFGMLASTGSEFEVQEASYSVREINPLAVSIQMDGLETFADEGSATQETLFDWRVDSNNRVTLALDTDSAKVGTLTLTMVKGSGTDQTISTTAELTPGVNDPFNVAIVCTSNEIGIALDGTAETRVSHSIGIPDLFGADATLGGNGTRSVIRVWGEDITDAGLEEATS